MSLGLLSADYASSSSSDDEVEEQKPITAIKLENPFASSSSTNSMSKDTSSTSVFSNPFLESELKKESILEKHVSLTVKQEDRKMINGKKVCWNFRKGRCRFGHTCSFAHDSDVHFKKLKEDSPESLQPTINKSSKRKSSRPGLSDSIEPSRKSKKHFEKTYN
nr:uncharacterized protein LOC121124718 [Lepeophtheirus salmonis]XP_040575838.1 uncharacterized protein LOC121124718 [Lepeophtheirus salmonis]